MTKRFITSDLHFGHEFVSKLRGFATPEEHDDAIALAWSKAVGPEDVVFVLGDITGRGDTWAHALHRVSLLPGSKHLVSGNHDSCSSIHANGWRRQREALEVFDSVRDFAKIRFRKQNVLMSHYPYDTDSAGDSTERVRYVEFRLRDEGLLLLHGHTHKADQKFHLSQKGTPQVHVGLDAWGGPVLLDHLLSDPEGFSLKNGNRRGVKK